MSRIAWLLVVVAGTVAGCGGDDVVDSDVDAAVPACTAAPAGPPAERVATTSGVVRGAMAGATWAYKGVPFAAPPVGALRFRAPAPAACAAGELDATAYGPVCPQLDGDVFIGAEDCLQLDVWAPAAVAAPRPVMVWIHGGANIQGSGADPIYDGRRLAEAGDVVVVTINYRLGQLGWLADAALPGDDGSVGNYGTLDQVAALRWVHDNIAGFGGDPGNVTIFGESAGGRNTCTLLVVPAAAGLFHRALVESGACKFLDDKAGAQVVADGVAAALACTGDRAACLRAASAEAVIRANASGGGVLESSLYGSVIDGVVLAEQPEAALAAGRAHDVPFAIGANADETARDVPANLTEAQYETRIHAQFGATLGDQVLAQYPAAAYPSPRAAFVRVSTDSRFVCPSREIAAHAAAGQTAPVFRYFFAYRATLVGAPHAVEIPFVFGTFDQILVNGAPYTPTAADLALSAAIQGYWTAFARNGEPAGSPAWPAYGAGDPTLVLDAPIAAMSGIRTADCDFWQPFYDAL
jgi:para-nitrobenzyl esterase